MTIRVCVAGATGWTGRPVAEAIVQAPDLELTSSVSRSAAGKDLGEAWGDDKLGTPVYGQVAQALEGVDVLVDYTSHDSIRDHTLTAIRQGVNVVIGASGLSASDLDDIGQAASAANVGVFAGGNFSLSATVAMTAALMAARYLPSWEIIDYASAGKPDAPSGTARELAERLAEIRPPLVERPVEDTAGEVQARGATIAGSQIHSVRLPSYELTTEIVFGLPHERLVIRHEGDPSPAKFVEGTLHAVRAVHDVTGLVRGMDTLLPTQP